MTAAGPDVNEIQVRAELEAIALLRAAMAQNTAAVNAIVTGLTCAAFTARLLSGWLAKELRGDQGGIAASCGADSIAEWLDLLEISLRELELGA